MLCSFFFVDPIFEAGGAGNTWIAECTDEKITRYDWKTGVDTVYPTAEIWASIRLVRKEGEAPPLPVGGKPGVSDSRELEAQQESEARSNEEPKMPLEGEAKSGENKPGPAPKKGGYSSEEKAVLLKRAKAYAASRKG